ncbi:MAG TPA: hypothetical protein VJ974_03720 [Geopsychrobacteraceae bacterium]|nr:hypothetical protein [Geopsychrobacteraceae bacterium]
MAILHNLIKIHRFERYKERKRQKSWKERQYFCFYGWGEGYGWWNALVATVRSDEKILCGLSMFSGESCSTALLGVNQ